ncbi:MAG: rRNA ((966)-N(2))-methyltransferase RsmD [Haloplasmataceae bacterium]|jgi:16S rRNA (guanine(966)-N(2))-methyltransferase RsmD|nr:rRNA ((966)-N(2))-methyltransferase RsmD [Haloplasmataceae bacterium]
MRIVSGTLRGRTIKAVPGINTRPTADKVKESLFNAIGQYFEGGMALDLYAGSGNLGIEAISRGIDKCVFVDKDFQAMNTIKENIETLSIKENSETYKMDAFSALNYFKNNRYHFDLVFLDPPYKMQKINDIIKYLEDNQLLNENALIIAECLREDNLLNEYNNVSFKKEYIYGITKVTIYQKQGVSNE